VHDVVKVLDFGLVKHMKDLEDPEQTDLRMIRGTPRYISPEAIEDPRGVDPRSDLYALGAVGYCLLAGRPVFDGSSVFQICVQHVQSTPIPLREVCPGSVPEELERLILSCLEKSKHDRPGSAQALADALDRIDLPPWTRADAQRWWELHGELVKRQRQSSAPPITGQTMDPPGARPWYEGG
jgi:serine/threonine protein kinase